MRKALTIAVLTSLLISTQALAWHNQFSVVNNQDKPLRLHIESSQGGVHFSPNDSSCVASNDQYTLAPNTSCQFELTDTRAKSKGLVTIDADDGEQCTYQYSYSYDLFAPLYSKHSVNFSKQSCSNGLAQGISLVNAKIKANARPMLTQLPLITLSHGAISMAKGDCGDPTKGSESADNCIIVSPAPAQSGTQTSVNKALAFQQGMSRYETLNNTQWIGSHNSAISPLYTHSTDLANVTFSDPDNFSTLTQQLNDGVRQIEFDLLWDQGALRFCHNHLNVPDALQPFMRNLLCDGNLPVSHGVAELNTWLDSHPNEVVFVLLDVNQDLGGHVADINQTFAPLKNRIYTQDDAKEDYQAITGLTLADSTLPTDTISKDTILSRDKQVVFVADTDQGDISGSPYLFTHALHTNTNLLTQTGVEHLIGAPQPLCDGADKYSALSEFYRGDSSHANIWRTNGDRTIINYLTSAKMSYGYNDYITLASIHRLQRCPLNVFSMNMIGLTCNQDDPSHCSYNNRTDSRPIDPRQFALLWSWANGYPAVGSNATPQAVLRYNSAIKSFRLVNDKASVDEAKHVLCHVTAAKMKEKGPGEWFITDIQRKGSNNAACIAKDGVFATPVTSYQMDDVNHALSQADNTMPVVVNYLQQYGQWVANDKKPLPTK